MCTWSPNFASSSDHLSFKKDHTISIPASFAPTERKQRTSKVNTSHSTTKEGMG